MKKDIQIEKAIDKLLNVELHGLDNDDFSYAVENNPQYYEIDDIEGIVAEVPGANDEIEWHWILKHKDGRYIYAVGGCDYTGWDCQSSLSSSQRVETKSQVILLLPEKDGERQIRRELVSQMYGKSPYGTEWYKNQK